jgi:molybdate transport system permease protein
VALDVQIDKELRDFNLSVAFTAEDEPVGILGSSGAGKTMLLRCIAGLERPDRGRIQLGDRVLFDKTQRIRVPARRRHVGMLFQQYALFPHKTVAENVGFGLRDLERDERETRVRKLLERTHIKGLEDRYPREISGGEQQRAALARALSIEPDALLLDEPLSALDTHLRAQMEIQLQETFATYRRPTLLVTHNVEEAYRLGEKLLVLSRGRVAAFGAKNEIFRQPPTLEVARLTGCKNFSRARAVSENEVEAIDWGCRLHVSQPLPRIVGHVAIRAHHIEFIEAAGGDSKARNIFPCWLLRSSETPFRVTLYVRLRQIPSEPTDGILEADLQAEVSKEKWISFCERPQPWHVRLSPDSLFVLPQY